MRNVFFGIFLVGMGSLGNVHAQMGIGKTAPLVSLDVLGSNAVAATTGSGANGFLRIKESSGNTGLDMGVGSVLGNPVFWMQARESNDYSLNKALLLQPIGGKLALGGTGLTETLNVLGDIYATGTVRGRAAGSVLHMESLDEGDLSLTSAVQTTSTSRTAVLSYTYTPISANSDIYIEVLGNAVVSGGGGDEWRSYLVAGGIDIQTRILDCENNDGGGGRGTSLFPLSGIYENSSTNAITIKVDVIKISSDDTFTLQNDVTLLITEIAR